MGQDLKRLVAALAKKNQPTAVELGQSNPFPQRPLAELLGKPEPEPTQFELDLFGGGNAPRVKGVNPYLPYYGRGSVEVKGLSETGEPQLAPMEKVKLNNALAKAKLGKRLTLAERRLLGKHNLARLMVRLRPSKGERE